MDGFMESSWYFLRYTAPNYKDGILDTAGLSWMPVDLYIGGSEHATKHLIYARFFTKMLSDWGLLPKDLREPFSRLLTRGMVLKDAYRCATHDYLYPEEVQDGTCKAVRPASAAAAADEDVQELPQRRRADGADRALRRRHGAPVLPVRGAPDSVLEWSEAGVEGCSRFRVACIGWCCAHFRCPRNDGRDQHRRSGAAPQDAQDDSPRDHRSVRAPAVQHRDRRDHGAV